MREFVDLKGASGQSYRFRLVQSGAFPLRIAGNYAMLKPKGEGFAVAHLGVTNDLSQAREKCQPLSGRGPFHLYVRLNVARAVREAEHEDIASTLAPTPLAAE
jgi:hypothetical protein